MRTIIPSHHERFGLDARASLPADIRLYVIGDIHGEAQLLDLCLHKIEQDLIDVPVQRARLLFLGDYIDRGPQSCQTIDRLIQCGALLDCIFLSGNHELLLMRALTDRSVVRPWLELGGMATLQSYGFTPNPSTDPHRTDALIQMKLQELIPKSHFKFFRGLQNSFLCGDFFFAHAGVRPGIPLEHQNKGDLLWIREEFLESDADFGQIVVHGHTAIKNVDIRRNRINIDTGAYATGKLTCLVMEADTLAIIESQKGDIISG